jgi:hypothetical protein
MRRFVSMYATSSIIIANIVFYQVTANIRQGSTSIANVHIQYYSVAVAEGIGSFPGNKASVVVNYILRTNIL